MTFQRDLYDEGIDVAEPIRDRHRAAAAEVCSLETYGHLIGGEWVDTDGGEVGEAVDATTGETIAEFQLGTSGDVDRAVEAASEAADGSWGETSPRRRAELLHEVADRLEDRKHEIAKLDSLEVGKPNKHSLFVDAELVVDQFRHFAGLARSWDGGRVAATDDGKHVFTRQEPYGVVGAIAAWNFPAMFVAWKLGPALATGNAVVYKPSERAVLSTLEVIRDVDHVLPPGTVNVVTGAGESVGEAITGHEGIGKVSVTGSVPTGKAAMRNAAETVTPISLELGGKSPNVIFPDADLEAAVEGTILGIFYNQGQQCVAGSRLLLHEDVADEFLDLLAARIEELQIGDPLSPTTDVGPQIDSRHQARVLEYLDVAREEGATVFSGGGAPADAELTGAPYVEPTVLLDVENTDTVAREEVFGPVLSVLTWADRAEMIATANDTPYGLAAGVWTTDLETAHETAAEIEAGTVWVNSYEDLIDPAPYGGWKESGFGKELAAEALEEYSRGKTVRMSFDDNPTL
jgi:aldehyde dehydrogenase (NAD+)